MSPEEQSFPAEFVKKVDPVCVKALGEVDKHAGAGIEIKDPGTLEKIAAAYEDAGTELDGQKPPEKNATAYGRFTQAFHDGGDLFTRMADEADARPEDLHAGPEHSRSGQHRREGPGRPVRLHGVRGGLTARSGARPE